MEKKTVGEILKERGIIKERPKEEEKKYKFEQEVSLGDIVMKIEKLGAEVSAIKDIKSQSDEKVRDLSEKIGEIRSQIFQRETMIKEMETKIRLINDSVADIEPKKIRKEMEKRKEEIEGIDMKMEKMDMTNKDILKKLQNVESVTGNIRSVENLEDMLKRINDAVEKGEKAKTDIDRLSAKTERFYLETENRVKEFPQFKIKLDKIDDLSKELTKTMDQINIRLANFVPKDELEVYKKSLSRVIAANEEKNSERFRDIEDVLKVPGEDIMDRKNNLISKKENIFKLLANLEEQNRRGDISREAYNEIKTKNESLLRKLDVEIKKLEGEESFSIKTLPKIINELESSMSEMERKINDFESKLRLLEGGSIETTLKTQTEISRSMLEKLREVNQKVSQANERIEKCDINANFFELLNMITRMEKTSDILSSMSEMEEVAEKMKNRGLWNSKKETLVKNVFVEMGEAWQDYGYDDVAQIFAEGLRKIAPNATEEAEKEENPEPQYIDIEQVQNGNILNK